MAAYAARLFRRHSLARALFVVAVAWPLFWSLPPVSAYLRRSLEGRYPDRPLESLPAADAIVVLGGMMRPGFVDHPLPDLGSPSDRVWHAARLYHAGKAPRIVMSGGPAPLGDMLAAEGDAMGQFAVDLGVPREAIAVEAASRSTRENALLTAKILRQQGAARVLLVTSAVHMGRALETFRAAGVDAEPAPTDFEVLDNPHDSLFAWCWPDAAALCDSTRALHEYVGWWVYWARGWTQPAE